MSKLAEEIASRRGAVALMKKGANINDVLTFCESHVEGEMGQGPLYRLASEVREILLSKNLKKTK